MKITDIELYSISVPLRTPFKTALRTVNAVEDIIVKINTDEGVCGYGEAPPTGVITGDTSGSIIAAIRNHIEKAIVGMDIEDFEEIMEKLHKSVIGNYSAKAAVDMALYDLFGQKWEIPLYKHLGGSKKEIITDITVSVNEPEEMAADALDAVNKGYKTLKIKVGKDSKKDLQRMQAIRDAVGYEVDLRIDANQGWQAKEAVKVLRQMEDKGLMIEFVEQPVAAHDFEGLKYVTDNVSIPVLADESVFSPMDAVKIMQLRAADYVNIKLMKCAGIHNALKITALGELYGVECMIGCMLEANVSVTAAVHLAMAKNIITKIDLDGPVLCSENPVVGGAIFDNYRINMSDGSGLAIKEVQNLRKIN